MVVNPDPAATPTDLTTCAKGGPLKPGEYVVHDTDDLATALPARPCRRGRRSPPCPAPPPPGPRPGPGTWPDREPIRIRIVDGGLTTAAQQAVKWELADRLLTVFLRQAEMVTVRLSSFPIDGGLDVMGIWNLLPAAVRAAQRSQAKLGLPLDVHAVPRAHPRPRRREAAPAPRRVG